MRRACILAIVGALILGIALSAPPVKADDTVVTLTGKMKVKYSTEPAKKDVVVMVSAAKTNAGVPLDGLKGRLITVVGPMKAEAFKLDNKLVLVTGTMNDENTQIHATSIKKQRPKIE
jgi:hypothetical protein